MARAIADRSGFANAEHRADVVRSLVSIFKLGIDLSA
jgi:hypothetical protein